MAPAQIAKAQALTIEMWEKINNFSLTHGD